MIGNAAKVRRFGGDLSDRRQRRLDSGQRGVHQFQRAVHVHVPGEEQVDLGGAAAGDGPQMIEALHRVDCFFDGPRHLHHHLVDGEDPGIHADHDARKVGAREDRDRNRESKIDPDGHQRQDDEDDRFAMTRRPVRRFGVGGRLAAVLADRSFLAFLAAPGTILTLALSSSPGRRRQPPARRARRRPGSAPGRPRALLR